MAAFVSKEIELDEDGDEEFLFLIRLAFLTAANWCCLDVDEDDAHSASSVNDLCAMPRLVVAPLALLYKWTEADLTEPECCRLKNDVSSLLKMLLEWWDWWVAGAEEGATLVTKPDVVDSHSSVSISLSLTAAAAAITATWSPLRFNSSISRLVRCSGCGVWGIFAWLYEIDIDLIGPPLVLVLTWYGDDVLAMLFGFVVLLFILLLTCLLF